MHPWVMVSMMRDDGGHGGGDYGKVDGGYGEDDSGDGDIRQFWTLLNRGGSQCKHQGDGLIEISF